MLKSKILNNVNVVRAKELRQTDIIEGLQGKEGLELLHSNAEVSADTSQKPLWWCLWKV